MEENIEKIKIEWGETSPEKLSWEQAIEWCKSLGGRLPTKEELESAFVRGVPGFGKDLYWSATEFIEKNIWRDGLPVEVRENVHLTDFTHGANVIAPKLNKCLCRLVREV